MLFLMATIDAGAAAERLETLPGWTLDGAAIRRTFTFAGFRTAIAFIVRLGFEAEEADHHPDILIQYSKVTVTLWTHDKGGVTDRDLRLARQIEAAAKDQMA